jgi:hypothetical protein
MYSPIIDAGVVDKVSAVIEQLRAVFRPPEIVAGT